MGAGRDCAAEDAAGKPGPKKNGDGTAKSRAMEKNGGPFFERGPHFEFSRLFLASRRYQLKTWSSSSSETWKVTLWGARGCFLK